MDNRQDPEKDKRNNNVSPQPEPETLHTTDPQKNMEGPVSSAMHQTGEAFETEETPREAEEKKDKNM